MKTITFIRHGQSTANAGGITMAHDAIPLSPLGEVQVRRLSALLNEKPPCIVASKYLRAQQTAAPYAQRVGQSVSIHPLLHEFSTIDPAMLMGMNGPERKPLVDTYWANPQPDKRMGHEAETFTEFSERVAAFLPEMATLPNQTVVFGHGMWIGMLIWQTLGFRTDSALAMKAFRRFQAGFPMPNGAVYHFQQTGIGWAAQVDAPIMLAMAAVSE